MPILGKWEHRSAWTAPFGWARSVAWSRRARPAPLQLPAAEAYALWAESYPPHAHNPVMAAEESAVAPLLSWAAPRRALDVGTGTGRNVRLLAAAGARTIVGADLSVPMLTRATGARRRVCADALHLPFASRSFDVVCSSLMVGDLDAIGPWVAEASRLLTRGGHLIYSDFHPEWAARGWRRTFETADGRECEIGYVAHSLDQHLDALAAAHLEVCTVREPRIDGRPAPAVIVFHAVKA